MYKTNDGILHTFTTNNYSMREMSTQIIVPGHVQCSLPILSEYYWARSMYDSSSSSSDNQQSTTKKSTCGITSTFSKFGSAKFKQLLLRPFPSTIDEEEDVTIFNSLPDYIKVSSENTDSHATIF